ASSPSRAVPTTSKNGLRESISRITLRTNAESSTTRTRTSEFITYSVLLLLHIDIGSINLFQLKGCRNPSQRFCDPNKQVTGARHKCGKLAHDARYDRRREIDEYIPTKHKRNRRDQCGFLDCQQVGLKIMNSRVEFGIHLPPVFDACEILLAKGDGHRPER